MVQKTMQQNAVMECKLEKTVKPRPQILEVHRLNKRVPTDYTGRRYHYRKRESRVCRKTPKCGYFQ